MIAATEKDGRCKLFGLFGSKEVGVRIALGSMGSGAG